MLFRILLLIFWAILHPIKWKFVKFFPTVCVCVSEWVSERERERERETWLVLWFSMASELLWIQNAFIFIYFLSLCLLILKNSTFIFNMAIVDFLMVWQVLRRVDSLRKKVVSVGKEHASLCAKVGILLQSEFCYVNNCITHSY